MIALSPDLYGALRPWFEPEVPGGGLAGAHVLKTGRGVCYVDRWPDPRCVLAACGANYALRGDAAAFAHAPLPSLAGFVDADAAFLPVLTRTYRRVTLWPRVLFRLDTVPPAYPVDAAAELRPLTASDADALAQLSPESAWIANTWGGPAGLAQSGHGWGIFVAGDLAAVACSFFVGARCEDIGIATEAAYRGRGYSPACTAALCSDIQRRGRVPTWATSTDNRASIRVAEKLGFTFVGEGVLYVVNLDPPPAEG